MKSSIKAAKNKFFSKGGSLVLYMLREVKAVRATEKGIQKFCLCIICFSNIKMETGFVFL